jgi:O-succinylbenzoic acid--CoA ligase
MTSPAIRIATHDAATVAAIHDALDTRRPIALLHAKLPTDEQARQRALVEAATPSDDDAVILFTSGSTGTSRGVVLSRAAIDAAAEATWAHLGVRANDRWLCTLPMAHAGGLSIVVRCRAAGVTCVLADDRDADRARGTWTIPAGVTLASLVPAQLADLLADGTWRPAPSLRAVLLGGAAAPRSLVDAALARGIPVLPTYGLTETFGQIATAREPGGALHLLPGVSVDGGTRAEPARLTVRGPMLASRYLDGTPIAPALATSDLGFVEGGILQIIGRADDVIITGGENVHPAQVEAVLAATPGVRAAVAFGVPDTRWGQLVAVALAVDASFDRAAALAHWHASLPPFARPRRLAIAAELPRLPSGKLDRRQVVALATSPIDYP